MSVVLKLTGEAPGSPDGSRLRALYYDILAGGTRVGTCELRPEATWTARWSGQVSYTVFPPYRGHRYALEALRLLCGRSKTLGLDHLTVTCRPENAASRRTLELAGAELKAVEEIPPEHPLRGSRVEKVCVYCIKL